MPYGISNIRGKIPREECHKILSKAYESGIQIIDTAEAYGNAHQVIGDFHTVNPGKIFDIISKIQPSDNLIRIKDKITKHLNELKVPQLEVLMFHSFHAYQEHRKALPELAKLKNNGIFRHLGVSIYTNDELNELISDNEIDLVQLPFNLLDNFTIRGELMKEAKRRGKIIHTRSAFLQGLFFKTPFDNLQVVQALKQQLVEIHEIAHEQDVSIASLSLGYCLAQSIIDQVLSGVDSLGQLESNLDAMSYQIDERTIQRINQIVTENKDLLNPSLWN